MRTTAARLRALLTIVLMLMAGGAVADSNGRPYVALVIDDLGNNWRLGGRVLDLPVAVTASVLPGTPYARKFAEVSRRQGREVIVHLPMESTAASRLGAHAVRLRMEDAGIRETLAAALASVPGAIGVSNHMGSLATADPVLMDSIMRSLSKRPRLLFVDSRTTPHSVAFSTARRHGIRAVQRDVFLDHVDETDEVGLQFERFLQRARRTGSALAIGHPIESTLDLLADIEQRLEIEGIRMVPISEFIRLRAAGGPGSASTVATRQDSLH